MGKIEFKPKFEMLPVRDPDSRGKKKDDERYSTRGFDVNGEAVLSEQEYCEKWGCTVPFDRDDQTSRRFRRVSDGAIFEVGQIFSINGKPYYIRNYTRFSQSADDPISLLWGRKEQIEVHLVRVDISRSETLYVNIEDLNKNEMTYSPQTDSLCEPSFWCEPKK